MKAPRSVKQSLIRLSSRGQAMLEYSLVTHLILGGGTLMFMVVFVRFMNSINQFFDSIYYVLQSSMV